VIVAGVQGSPQLAIALTAVQTENAAKHPTSANGMDRLLPPRG
jgi:hypothetical protein